VPRSDDWVERQLRRRGITDARVLDAMRRVPRERFVPADELGDAYADAALALGHGQTISQPFIVGLICQSLVLTGDEQVLDVGTGSGYQAAVLAELARHVVSIERIPELAADARRNLDAAGYADRVELRVGDGSLGVPDRAPFDGIAVAAAASDLPPALWEQLADGGRLVLPIGKGLDQRLELFERLPGGQARHRTLAPVRFVPLVS
jgi:protein-L-isoaspartate(D-aspartate) O-methyltransferase